MHSCRNFIKVVVTILGQDVAELIFLKKSRSPTSYFDYLIFFQHMNPILTGKKVDPHTLESYEKRMVSAIETFASNWLDNGTEFVSGDSITVADLLAACELEQPSK